jgi:eukaryotic-like serine/threonine-protein kinase
MAVDAARAKSLFLNASDIADPAERAAYLDRECGGDAELRARVEALLRANDAAPLPLAEEVNGTGTYTPNDQNRTADYGDPTALVGSVLAGRYKLVEEIGEGGMGSVFMAQQTEPVRRAVAVKVIKAGMDSKAVLARFEAERQALAMMDHPHIARVLDAGTTDGGRPFFVMELVKGTPITQFCDERKLTPRQRLELFVPVCQAIQHAHQKGVIHRDIKPSNVLVAMYDDRPVPKVIDFGVAKAAGQSLTDRTLMTGFGAVVGTPEYMSPEQASLNNLDVDTRSDVYSLGVLLYELLTGSTPVDRKSLGKAAVLEVLRIVREVEALRPSARLSTIDTLPTVAANRGTEPAKLSKLMKGELDWLVMKALEKDRTRRYETANGLARDIQRYLADEVVEARPPSAGYRLKKFVRRHPLELALAGTVVLLLLGGGTVAWWQSEQAAARRETDLRRRLEDEQRSAADRARLGRNAEAVAALLGQCEEALRAHDAAKAAVALDAARKRSAEGGADEHAQRLGRLAADLALLRELDAIDQFRWTWVANQFPDPEAVAARTREALGRFGADPDAVPADDAAARVSASLVRERIVTALDRRLRQEGTAGLRAVLRRVDADPYRDAVRDALLDKDRAKFIELVGQTAALEQPPGFAAFLGDSEAIPVERRRELLLAAVSRRPKDVALLMTLGTSYTIKHRLWVNERLRWFQAALAAAPNNVAALNDVGAALSEADQVDEAIPYLRKAVALDPTVANAHANLGHALSRKGRRDEAIRHLRKAIALDPTRAFAHDLLGSALQAKGQRDAAIECFQKAIAFDPDFAGAYNNLGVALTGKGRWDEALACFEKAVALDPKDANAHTNLGNVLTRKGQVDEAITYCEKAVALDPKSAAAHRDLGHALRDKGEVDGAIAYLKKAIALGPKDVGAHVSLGALLCDVKKDYDGAIACFEKALELDPKSAADAHTCLGVALYGKGQADKALACFRKALELDPKHANAHFNLACSLVQAAQRDSKDQVRLRRQALDSLREALALHAQNLEAGTPVGRAAVQRELRHWQQDTDLASVRDAAALARLPAREREAFTRLWADVAALVKKAEALTPRAASAARPNPTLSATEHAFQLVKADLGPDHPGTLKIMHNLAGAYKDAGKIDRMLPLLEELLKLRKAKLGPDHPDTLQSMNNLAWVYVETGQLGRALPLYEETLKLRKARLGPDHPQTLQTLANLAGTYSRGKQHDKSIPLLEEALKRQEAKLGRDHRATLLTAANLGANYKDVGRLKEAIPLLEEAQRAARKYPELRWVLGPLLESYARTGENARHANLLHEHLPEARKALPGDSPQLAGVLAQIGLGFLEQKKWAEAEPLLRECLAIREKKEPDDWRTFNTQSMLGGALLGQQKYPDAEPLLRKGYEGMKAREKTIPPQANTRIPEALDRLIELSRAMKRPDDAEKWRAERAKYPEAKKVAAPEKK